MKIIKLSALFFMVFSLFLPIEALACACCAEKGQYTLRTSKPDQYIIGELKRLQIDTTELYTDEGYPETIEGIKPLGETFTGDWLWQSNIWKFRFKDNKNKTGDLNLTRSTTMVDYRADLHDTPEGVETVLYKELRFKYNVKSATGIFKGGMSPDATYFLVFQGRGNNCQNAEDFTHWRLEIDGKKSRYAFYGKTKVKP